MEIKMSEIVQYVNRGFRVRDLSKVDIHDVPA